MTDDLSHWAGAILTALAALAVFAVLQAEMRD